MLLNETIGSNTDVSNSSMMASVQICNESYNVLCRRLTSGSYGTVYVGRAVSVHKYRHMLVITASNTRTHKLVAVKVESPREKRLQNETLIYQLLHRKCIVGVASSSMTSQYVCSAAPADNPEAELLGILHVRYCVQRRALLMPLLGPSLEDIFQQSNQRLSPTTVALLAAQLVRAN
jgi:hypothetical protein